jgi:hyperosmotically inducible protein
MITISQIRQLRSLILAASVCACSMIGYSQTAPQETAPNNTKQNAQTSPTADQQKSNESDRQLTKNVRHAIIRDKTLSTDAHNVKVITQDGQVTLKGPVKSEEEKEAIGSKAAEIAGQGNVVNDLTVAPPKQ